MNLQDMIQSVENSLSLFSHSQEDEEKASKIIDAMEKIDRRFFMDNTEHAYIDSAMPVGHGQTISQPSTVARMLMLLDLSKGENALWKRMERFTYRLYSVTWQSDKP